MNRILDALLPWRAPPPAADAPPGELRGGAALRGFGRLLGLGCLTLLLCLPVLTAPAALTAFSRVCFERAERGACLYPLQTFWQEARQDFWRRLPSGLLPLLLPPALGALGNALAGPAVGAGLLLAAAALAAPAACWLYLLFAAADLPVPVNVRNAALLALGAGFPVNLRLTLLTALPLLLGWVLFPLSLSLLPLLPSLAGPAVCRVALPLLHEHILRDQAES